jgi:Txe/YoeB family toxin of Txe-Axe toxin-antitoxin module
MVVKKMSEEDKQAMSIAVKKVMKDNKVLADQIKRDTSRLGDEKFEELKKRMQKLYMWIWILLGLLALLLIILFLR